MKQSAWFDSPVGLLKITGSQLEGVTAITFHDEMPEGASRDDVPACLDGVLEQLEEYFAKKRKTFDLRLTFRGTIFQKAVWTALQDIPYGQTYSYLKIAMQLGDRKAVRAIGAACKQNPIPIIAPCHRVIGIDGNLTGYEGGLDRKQNLLMLENPYAFGKQTSLFS